MRLLLAVVVAVVGCAQARGADSALPYKDDPKIIALLKGLGDNTALKLPHDRRKKEHFGRAGNDYSMRMVYAPERQTAMYAGGNHNNGRRNDCWEYHLGSNIWHQLFPAEGGDHYFMKGIVMYRMRAFNRKFKDKASSTMDDLRKMLKEKDRKTLDEKIIPWWKKHMILKDGMVCTSTGGPFMTSHTWDGLCYDPVKQRMLWSSGGTGGDAEGFHRLVTGMSRQEIAKKLDKSYTKMWTFDPVARKWIRYRKPKAGPCPDFRGMGQSLVYMPDRKKFIWYVSAANVVPHSFQMWSYDPAIDKWQKLAPNGGKSIGGLVKAKLAPPGEQVIRYSPRQKKLYGFQRENVFAYDVAGNKWSKICSDERINSHDAHVAIAYDSINDVFIYTRKSVKGKLVRLAVFDPAKGAWEVPTLKGAPLPKTKYGKLKGFFDPVHNVYAIITGGWTPGWVYRYKRAEKKSGK
jgi:hypothetical protein